MATPASAPRLHDNQQPPETSPTGSQASYLNHGSTTDSTILPAGYAEVPPKRKPLTVLALVAGAAVLLLVGGIASRLLFNNKPNDNSLITMETPAPTTAVTPSTLQTATQAQGQPPRPAERALPQPTQQPLLEHHALKQEIVDALNGWAAAARDHDLDAQMSYYADSLDTYFARRNVSAGYVRKTREAAFTRYTTLDVQLGPITVEIDPSGTIATATFDKTYRFEGDKILSGSVRQELSLTKISDRWRITGERDMHVYYTNR